MPTSITDQDKLTLQVAGESTSGGPKRLAVSDEGNPKVDNELQEIIRHPFGKGVLTTDGIQYSAEKTTSTDDWEAVETITFNNPGGHTLEEIEFGLTMAIKSSGATESVLWKWQASDDGISWEDLIAQQTRAASAAAYLDVTASGRFALTGNFLGTGSTFQVRAMIKSGGAGGETATGKTKNSGYIYAKYRRA